MNKIFCDANVVKNLKADNNKYIFNFENVVLEFSTSVTLSEGLCDTEPNKDFIQKAINAKMIANNEYHTILVDDLTFFNFFIANQKDLVELNNIIKVTNCIDTGEVNGTIISFTTLKPMTFIELLKAFNNVNIDLAEDINYADCTFVETKAI